MYRRIFIFVLIAVGGAAFLASCSRGYKLSVEQLDQPSAWRFHRGDIGGSGAIATGSFDGHFDVVWERRESGRPAGPLTLDHGALVFPSIRRRFKFFDALTGEYLGKINTKRPSPTGLVVQDTIGCFAVEPRYNDLICLDLLRRDELWRRSVKDASKGSILVEDRLLVGSSTGTLTAYGLADGQPAWTFRADGGFLAPATFGHGSVYQPAHDGLYALSPADGTERFRVETVGPMVNSVAAADLVVGADMLGHVYGIDPADGRIVWQVRVDGPVWTAPAVADGRVFVGHSGGELVALNATDGSTLWRFRTVEVVRASPLVVGPYVIVGTLAGKLYSLQVADGIMVDRRDLTGGISISPISDGERVYVATEAGYIICFGEEHDQTQQVRK